jgi:hypothetical protein
MSTITIADLAESTSLTKVVQVRFTEAQYQLLSEIARRSRASLSGVIRDVVVSWVADDFNDEAWLKDEPPVIDVWHLADQLRKLSELEDRLA